MFGFVEAWALLDLVWLGFIRSCLFCPATFSELGSFLGPTWLRLGFIKRILILESFWSKSFLFSHALRILLNTHVEAATPWTNVMNSRPYNEPRDRNGFGHYSKEIAGKPDSFFFLFLFLFFSIYLSLLTYSLFPLILLVVTLFSVSLAKPFSSTHHIHMKGYHLV